MGLLRTHTNEDLWGRRFHAAAALPGGVLFSRDHGSVFRKAFVSISGRRPAPRQMSKCRIYLIAIPCSFFAIRVACRLRLEPEMVRGGFSKSDQIT